MAAVESGQQPVSNAVYDQSNAVYPNYQAPNYCPPEENQVEAPVEAQPVADQNDWDGPVESQEVVQDAQLEAGKMKGTCKWFNNPRGYGFIEGEDGVDYFVHQTSIKARGYKSLQEGESLEFELSREEGRVKAINVTGPGGADVIGTANPSRDSYGRGGGGGGGGGGYSGGGRSNVCYAWQKGVCERGDSCRFAHQEDEGGYDNGGGGGGGGGFGGGNSFGGGGGYGGAGRKRGVCFAWQRGECFRGESCKFSHEDDGGGGGNSGGGYQGAGGGGRGRGGYGEKRGVCYAWQRGECYRGESCRFEHQETE